MSHLCRLDDHVCLQFNEVDLYLLPHHFTGRRLHLTQQPRSSARNEEAAAIIETEWHRYALAQSAIGKYGHLTVSQLFRFEWFSLSADAVNVGVSHTDYKEVYGTNITHPELIHTLGADHMGNALGLCSIVTTADGFIGLFRRSGEVLELPGYYHLCAGLMERGKKDVVSDPDVFAAMAQEIKEELSVDPGLITKIFPIGLCRGLVSYKPELLFIAELAADRATMARTTLNFEHKSASWLSESDTCDFVAANWERFAPAAKGALGIYLLGRLGEEGFRGRLPTVALRRIDTAGGC
jgi:8-oxo-dGTP pyrophosphatase MutT (NUDIX family)